MHGEFQFLLKGQLPSVQIPRGQEQIEGLAFSSLLRKEQRTFSPVSRGRKQRGVTAAIWDSLVPTSGPFSWASFIGRLATRHDSGESKPVEGVINIAGVKLINKGLSDHEGSLRANLQFLPALSFSGWCIRGEVL